MNYSNLRTQILASMKYPPKITAQALQEQLINIVNGLDLGALLLGVATPSLTPNTEANGFYFGLQPGTYTNFPTINGETITVDSSEVAIIVRSGNYWSKIHITTYPSIDPTTKHWMIGNEDTGVLAEGTDGVTPHIDPETGNWFIGTTNTGIHAQGAPGQDAYQPFKGTFASVSDLNTAFPEPNDGDTAYVEDTVDNATVLKVYDVVNGEWHDTGTTADSPVFGSGQFLSSVKIDDTHLANPAEGSLPKAEDVLQLKAKIGKVNVVESKVTFTTNDLKDGYVLCKSTSAPFSVPKIYSTSGTSNRHIVIDVEGYDSVRFLGRYAISSVDAGWAFYDSTNYANGEFLTDNTGAVSYNTFDIGANEATTKEYIIKIPAGAKYLKLVVNMYQVTLDNFYCYLQKGVKAADMLSELANTVGSDNLIRPITTNQSLVRKLNSYISVNKSGIGTVESYNGNFSYIIAELPQSCRAVSFRGFLLKSTTTTRYGYDFGVYDSDNDTFVSKGGGSMYDKGETTTLYPEIYNNIPVPDGATHIRITDAIGTTPPVIPQLVFTVGKGLDIFELREEVDALEQRVSQVENSCENNTELLQGFSYSNTRDTDFIVTNGKYVAKSDGTLQTNNAFKVAQTNVEGVDFITFLGIYSQSSTIQAGYALGYYDEGYDNDEAHWHTTRYFSFSSGAPSSNMTKEYNVKINPEDKVFRTSIGFGVTTSNFYIYKQSGQTVKQYVDALNGIARRDLVGKKYCNMSSSTFSSFNWHKNLIEDMGMEYYNVGVGGARCRGLTTSKFSLNYDNTDSDKIILNMLAKLLTKHVTDGYTPDFVVICCVLNDCSNLAAEQIETYIGTSDSVLAENLPTFNCESASSIETDFTDFIEGSNFNRLVSMYCFRIALELMSKELPTTQVVVVSSQYCNVSYMSQEAISFFNGEQEKLCKAYSIPYIDLNSEVGVNFVNYKTYLSQQGSSPNYYYIHPNANGENLYYNYMKLQLEKTLVCKSET